MPRRINQLRTFAAQCFGGQRGRVVAMRKRAGQGGRMKLHKYGIGDLRAGACRHGQRFATGAARIGGDGIKMTNATGRHNHRAGANEERPG